MPSTDAGELDLLRSTAAGLFADGAGLAALGEYGLLGLLTPEEQGGSGWHVVEACAVATEAGRALSPVPWAGTLLVVGHSRRDLATTARRPRSPEVYAAAQEVADQLGTVEPGAWQVLVAEARPRAVTDPEGRTVTVHDEVLRARRLP